MIGLSHQFKKSVTINNPLFFLSSQCSLAIMITTWPEPKNITELRGLLGLWKEEDWDRKKEVSSYGYIHQALIV